MRALCVDKDQKSFLSLIDEKRCYEMLREARWPDGQVRCPYCSATDIAGPWRGVHTPESYRYRCRACGRGFNDRTGTVFERSKMPLRAWFLAIYLVELNRSTAEIARELPCDYHTAHRIVWLIREREMHIEAGRKLEGVVEVDEIYQTAGHKGRAPKEESRCLGRPPRRRGKKQGPGRGSAAKDAPALIGMVSRDGKMVLEVAPDVRRESLEPLFEKAVKRGSTIYTDSASCYRFLPQMGYVHDSVNHTRREYARGPVHVNRGEAVWSLWRPFIATFRGIAQRNLHAYARTFQFRRNHRHLTAFGRLNLILSAAMKNASKPFLSLRRWLNSLCSRGIYVPPIPI